jgi:hypothetical protein
MVVIAFAAAVTAITVAAVDVVIRCMPVFALLWGRSGE